MTVDRHLGELAEPCQGGDPHHRDIEHHTPPAGLDDEVVSPTQSREVTGDVERVHGAVARDLLGSTDLLGGYGDPAVQGEVTGVGHQLVVLD
jgi:hypothetical protein